jgi:predicted patatin/cPLA2 family phospholipase
MNAQKAPEAVQARSSASTEGRKPWKKKTPVEVVLNQIDRLREGVAAKEEELKQTRRQLQKLEEVKKILEAT